MVGTLAQTAYNASQANREIDRMTSELLLYYCSFMRAFRELINLPDKPGEWRREQPTCKNSKLFYVASR